MLINGAIFFKMGRGTRYKKSVRHIFNGSGSLSYLGTLDIGTILGTDRDCGWARDQPRGKESKCCGCFCSHTARGELDKDYRRPDDA